MNKVIVIAGPTATGKTALSVKLAKEIGGEVISADSVQIYKELNIGSAKPTEEEMNGVLHHMIDILAPDETFSVAQYVACAKEKIAEIHAKNRVPIIAGGTGLYISSLVHNVSFTDEDDDKSIRESLIKELSEIGNEAMHERLSKIDPEAAKSIHPNNTKRVIRAIEIYEKTGKTMTQQNEASKQVASPYEFILIGLSADREILYQRINQRVDVMVKNGLFDEVSSLLKRGVSAMCQSMQGIGYKEAVSHLTGEIDFDTSVELIKKNSRNYAKRQLTWFRREDYKWFDVTDTHLFETVRSYIGEYGI